MYLLGDPEDNIPIPETYASRLTNPLRELKVGQSILFADYSNSASIRANACRIAKVLNAKYTCRKMPDGIRVWRIE